MKSVYLLWHTHQLNQEDEDEKLIGVYSTKINAEAAMGRVRDKPGFIDTPEGFEIVKYKLDEDNWTEGYISIAEAINYLKSEDKKSHSHMSKTCNQRTKPFLQKNLKTGRPRKENSSNPRNPRTPKV
jgi:hypothetical protein